MSFSKWIVYLSLFAFAACSSTPYSKKTSDGKYGYWSEKLSDGTYRVFVSHNSGTYKRDAHMYLLIRGYELCRSQNMNYFDEGEYKVHSEFEAATISTLILCYKNTDRKGFGVVLDNNGKTVNSIVSKKNNKFKVGDELVSVGGKEINSINDFKIAAYDNRFKKRVTVKIIRNGKARSIKTKMVSVPYVFSIKDVEKWMEKSGVEKNQVTF